MTNVAQSGRDPMGALEITSITEILVGVLENLGKADIAAATRVCRSWLNVALDTLWEELESLPSHTVRHHLLK